MCSSDLGNLGLGRVVDDEELIGAGACGLVDAGRSQAVLKPELGGVLVGGTLDDGRRADLIGGAGAWKDETDVVIAVVDDLVDAVMQHADADGALTGAEGLGGATTGLGVLRDVLVEVDEVLDATS